MRQTCHVDRRHVPLSRDRNLDRFVGCIDNYHAHRPIEHVEISQVVTAARLFLHAALQLLR